MRQGDLENVGFKPRWRNVFTPFVLALVALITALIGWIAYVRYDDFRHNHVEIARGAVAQASAETSLVQL